MDIVLATINAKWIHPSLALRLLKANLQNLESSCEILEFALRQPLNEKIEPIVAARPRILGLSVSIWNHLATLELLKALETAWQQDYRQAAFEKREPGQKPIIVLGGPEVSWLPEQAEIFYHADYVIRGEGEESFRSLCSELLKKNPSDQTIDKKTIFINQSNTIVNLNENTSPYRLYTDEDLKQKLVYVEASRGCPYSCEFCQASVRHNADDEIQQIRHFPLDIFLSEMDILIKRGGRSFKFLDRTFNLDINRSKKIIQFFLDRIKELQTEISTAKTKCTEQEKPLSVHFEMVPSRFPQALCELLCQFPPGTLRLEIGIQTLNPDTLVLIKRPINFQSLNRQSLPLFQQQSEELKILEFLRRETNAILHVDLIAGLPGEGLASFAAGFDRLWQTLSGASSFSNENHVCPSGKAFEIQLGILKGLPGTPIARHNETHRMKHSHKPPYEVIETGALSAAELDKIKNFARFWEIIVNRNPFPDLIPHLLPPGKPVFDKFMCLSDRLLEHFGRNWGIDRGELKSFLACQLPIKQHS